MTSNYTIGIDWAQGELNINTPALCILCKEPCGPVGACLDCLKHLHGEDEGRGDYEPADEEEAA